MMDIYGRTEFEVAAAAVRDRISTRPVAGMILGSGLSSLADAVEDATVVPYEDIPGWPVSTVEGHAGELHIGTLEGQSVIVMKGRSHFYEGYPISQITLPVRVMQLLDIKFLFVTNAAGGMNPNFEVGDVMLIRDHINMVGMTGNNPLRGPNDKKLGERFPDMSSPYDRELRKLAREVADEGTIPLQAGVYVCLSGPSFETPAEVRMLHMMGADAVGMSTAHEVTVARHGKIRVLGMSGITNKAILDVDSEAEATHEEVLEAGKVIAPRMEQILRGVLRRLPADN